MAGRTPTKPQPRGMMAMLPATVWTRTFSTGVKGKARWRLRVLKRPKPMSEAGMVIMLTQPVCRPKYMLEKQMTRPTKRPAATPRRVKLRPWGSNFGGWPESPCWRRVVSLVLVSSSLSSRRSTPELRASLSGAMGLVFKPGGGRS